MAQLLKDDFAPKGPITQVPTTWFNRVAKMLNGLVGGMGINVTKDGTDTAGIEIGLDPENARKCLGVYSPAPNAEKRSEGQGDTAAQIAAKYSPKQIVEHDDEETITEKINRIGVLNESARADHVHADRVVFNATSTKPNFADMVKCELSPNGYGHVLTFYPPVVDDSGRVTGISSTAAWSVDLLDNV